MYSWVGSDRPADVIAGMKALQAGGLDHFKLNGCEEMGIIDTSRAVDAAAGRVAEIRAAFGNTVEFGLDFHGRVSAPMAKVLIKELEPYRPLFIEEPVLAEQAETNARLAAHTHLPICPSPPANGCLPLRPQACAGGRRRAWAFITTRALTCSITCATRPILCWKAATFAPPRLPGLGVDINEALVIERSKEARDWRNPVWRHADGSVAEW
jgi:galactonate dehydratase